MLKCSSYHANVSGLDAPAEPDSESSVNEKFWCPLLLSDDPAIIINVFNQHIVLAEACM